MQYHVFKNYDGGEELEDLAFDFDGDMSQPGFSEAAEDATGFDRYFSITRLGSEDGPRLAVLTNSELREVTIVAASDLEAYQGGDDES